MDHNHRQDSPQDATSVLGLLGRFFWMMVGPLLLIVLAVSILTSGGGWWTAADAAFVVVLAGMLLGRWLEFRSGNARTSYGEPAPPEHLKRYAAVAAGTGAALWTVANLLGNHIL